MSISLTFTAMLNTVILSSLAALAAAAPLAGSCNDYVILDARGTFEPQGPSAGFKTMVASTLSALPGGVQYDVVYPAAPDVSQNGTFIGSEDIQNYINNGHAACPDQKYALLGYSQGATVVLEALQALSGSEPAKQIKAALLIGNPYQVSGQATTVDQNNGSITRGFSGALLPLAGSLDLDPKLPQDGTALNICYVGDPVCTGLAFTVTSGLHLAYPFDAGVQQLGAKHLLARLS